MSDDKGLFFSSRHYTGTARTYRLTQKFKTPYTLKQNELLERFESARMVIDRLTRYYNEEQSHQSLDYEASRAHSTSVA